jgi:cytidine deaminase
MYHAFGARLRSADLARQVGACIATEDGQVLALGMNDVSKAGGGQYWDEPYVDPAKRRDGRDFHRKRDESNVMRRKLFVDTIELLGRKGYLDDETVEKLRTPGAFNAVREGRLMAVTEYARSVHAEMAAITDAARRGTSIEGAVLYTSTFPCHNCAKHIVASGIQRVVFVHAYPKSLVETMYDDSISVDVTSTAGRVLFETFVGVAPRRYDALFRITKQRKRKDGEVVQWGVEDDTVALRIEGSPLLSSVAEDNEIQVLDERRAGKHEKFNTRVEPDELDGRRADEQQR